MFTNKPFLNSIAFKSQTYSIFEPPPYSGLHCYKMLFNQHIFRCGPCKNIAPFVDDMSVKYPNAHFLKVDVEECPETAVAYNVNSMPTFIFLRNKIR